MASRLKVNRARGPAWIADLISKLFQTFQVPVWKTEIAGWREYLLQVIRTRGRRRSFRGDIAERRYHRAIQGLANDSLREVYRP